MNKLLQIVFLLSLIILATCEERERSNPVDSLTDLDPSEWAPTNLNTLRLSSNEILLTWEYDRDDISGFKLDSKINNNDWVLEYAVMEQELREWTDTLAFASDSISYYYRLYAYAGSNVSSYDEVMFNDNAPQPVELDSVTYENGSFVISWSQNNDTGFESYTLYESTSEDMSSETLIFETDERTDTTYVRTGISEWEYRYYQIIVENEWGFHSSSNVGVGDSHNWFVKTFGESSNDYGYSVQQTEDDGYIITGYTQSFGNGNYDVWLVKTNSNGDEEWNQTFGGSDVDEGHSVQQTTDGGYIIIGYTYSFGNGESDVWLIKTDSNGNEEWNQSFGGSDFDEGHSVQQTSDGGYIITGYSNSFEPDWWEDTNVWLIKTDSQGNEEWDQGMGENMGSDLEDYGWSVRQTTDGGYIIAGHTESSANSTFLHNDVWLIKTDSGGQEEWSQTFGGSGDDVGESVQQTTDGGYIITGYTESYGNGQSDVWLIKTNSNGDEEWNQTFGGNYLDKGWSVQQTTDGGYIITGYTESYGNGGQDVWLIKTDSEGNTAPY